jgi:pyruvoyl-dependent arginine decarboxylase (PvlArgDC)
VYKLAFAQKRLDSNPLDLKFAGIESFILVEIASVIPEHLQNKKLQ